MKTPDFNIINIKEKLPSVLAALACFAAAILLLTAAHFASRAIYPTRASSDLEKSISSGQAVSSKTEDVETQSGSSSGGNASSGESSSESSGGDVSSKGGDAGE